MKAALTEETSLAPALVRFLQEDAADEAQIERAYRRFALRRLAPSASPKRPLLAAFFAGMLLSIGTLYAATSAPWHLLGFQTKSVAEPAPASAPRADEDSPTRPQPAEEAAPATTTEPPSPAPSVSPSRAVVPESSAAAQETWRRAVAGLREQDYDTASDALLKLSQQGSRSEREAARLVRAQLLLSQGRATDASLILEDLKVSAESPLVRRKATELLAAASPSHSSDRSFEPEPPTNQP